MIHLNLNGGTDRKLQILCLGSHSDDIEIGCGGTIRFVWRSNTRNVPFIGWCSAAMLVRLAEAQPCGFTVRRLGQSRRPLPEEFSRTDLCLL